MPPEPKHRAGEEPSVYVDFQVDDGLLYITIANSGAGPAHGISVRFDRKIVGLRGEELNLLRIFKSLGFLPPGKSIRVFVDTLESYSKRGEPKSLTAKVLYHDAGGRPFHGVMHHDLSIYDGISGDVRRADG